MTTRIRRALILALLAAFIFSTFASIADAAVRVRGYYRKDGTYVQPHYRSNPDGNPYNNWSFPGNVNPYTGKIAPGNPDTYLRNYYNRGGSGISLPSYSPPSYSSPSSPIGAGAAAGGAIVGGTILNGLLICDRGYKKNYSINNCEPVVIPSNAQLNYFGDDFVCNRGYKRNYQINQCEPVIVPPNASLSYSGDSWYCNRGHKRVDDSCVPVQVPPNASLGYFGDDWSCNRGYKRVGDSCIPIQVPPNASLGYFGNEWYCNRGFKRVGSMCEPVQVPTNGYLSYFGDTWYCRDSFRTNYQTNTCDPISIGISNYSNNSNQNYSPSSNAFRIKYHVKNYHDSNRTCVGLSGDDYRDCISYALNQDKNWLSY